MLRALVKDSAIYAVGTVASRLVGFIMIPVYTRVLTPTEYGIIETIVRLVDVISLFLALGLAEALLRHYYTAENELERRRLIGSALSLNLLVVLAGSVVTLPLAPLLGYLAFGHDRYTGYITVSIISMLVGNLMELPLTLWRAEAKPWRFTMFSLAKLCSQVGLNILFVVVLRWGVWGVVLGGLASSVVWSAVLGWTVRRRYGICWDKVWLQRVLRYGLPLVPASLAQFILHYSDRFFLTRYATEAELGLYSLAYRFGMLVSVFYGIVSRAWWPLAFRIDQEEGASRHVQRGTTLVLLSFAAVSSGVALFARPLIQLVAAPRFWEAGQFAPPLAVAYWFFVAQGPLSTGARLANRTDALGGVNIAVALTCLLLSALLIPAYGVWGAVWVTVVSMALLAGGSGLVSWYYKRIPLQSSPLALSLMMLVAALSVDYLLSAGGAAELYSRFLVWIGFAVVAWYVLRKQIQHPADRVAAQQVRKVAHVE